MRRDRSARSPERYSLATTTPVTRPAASFTALATRSSSPPPAMGSSSGAASAPAAARAARRSAEARDQPWGSDGDATSTSDVTSTGPSAARTMR